LLLLRSSTALQGAGRPAVASAPVKHNAAAVQDVMHRAH
jgi:hypothetical protein